jgi:hypothetical protein
VTTASATGSHTHAQNPRNASGRTPACTPEAVISVPAVAIVSSATTHMPSSVATRSPRLFTPPTGSLFSSASRARFAAISASIAHGSAGRSSLQTPGSASTDRTAEF